MEKEAVIGLEIHVEMKTKSKMFSTGNVSFGDDPNTNTVAYDFAFPGTMPTVNKQAVINAIQVSNALNMEIDDTLYFERKNYFYSDLPKGYQITQQFRPIGKNGYLVIQTSNGPRKIRIERLHMEEDTCKQLHSWDCSLLDYNRSGIPLIEIVSKPDIRSGEEAMKYVEKIRSIVSFLDVSDGKMEEGSLRVDVNISIKDKNSDVLGTKVEIKNLNSIANIGKAIDFETQRQIALLELGLPIIQETKRFDEGIKETVTMREKTDAVDYKYFTDPNLPPIQLSNDFISNAINSSLELAESKLERYKKLGLSDYDCELLISNKDISCYYDKLLEYKANPKLAANWLIVDVQAVLNKENVSIKEFKISANNLAKLISLIENNVITNKIARELFVIMLKDNSDPCVLAEKLKDTLIDDKEQILHLVIETINEYPQSIIDYKNGKDRALGFLVGHVMKKSKGKANPKLTSDMILEEIKRR